MTGGDVGSKENLLCEWCFLAFLPWGRRGWGWGLRTPTGARSLLFWLLMRAEEEEEGEDAEPKARHGSSVASGSPEVCRPLPAVSLSYSLLKAFPDASQLRQEERVPRAGHVSDNRYVCEGSEGSRGQVSPSHLLFVWPCMRFLWLP